MSHLNFMKMVKAMVQLKLALASKSVHITTKSLFYIVFSYFGERKDKTEKLAKMSFLRKADFPLEIR